MNDELRTFLENNKFEVVSEKELFKGRRKPEIYIGALSDFHRVFIEENNSIRFKFHNEIWKIVQTFKVWNRRVERININNNILELIKNQSKNSVNNIENLNFKKLIRRAMDRKEVCIDKIYFPENKAENNIVICENCNITFSMIEDGYYNYFKRLKTENKLSYRLIEMVLSKENLENDSFIYLKSLILYPYNTMKYLQSVYVRCEKIDFDKVMNLANKDFLI